MVPAHGGSGQIEPANLPIFACLRGILTGYPFALPQQFLLGQGPYLTLKVLVNIRFPLAPAGFLQIRAPTAYGLFRTALLGSFHRMTIGHA